VRIIMEVSISLNFSIMETGTALWMNEISGRKCGLSVPFFKKSRDECSSFSTVNRDKALNPGGTR
jgi:hypothetical protein